MCLHDILRCVHIHYTCRIFVGIEVKSGKAKSKKKIDLRNLFIAFMMPNAPHMPVCSTYNLGKVNGYYSFQTASTVSHYSVNIVHSISEVYLSFYAFAITICHSQPSKSHSHPLASIAGFHFIYFSTHIHFCSIRFHNFGNYYICNFEQSFDYGFGADKRIFESVWIR